MLPYLPAELLVASAWGFAAAVLSLAVLRWRQKQARQARIAALHMGPARAARGAASQHGLRARVAALGRLLGMRQGNRYDRLTRLIDATGMAGRMTPAEIFGWQLLLTAGGVLSTIVLWLANWSLGLLFLPVLGIGGWFGPTLWLKYRRRARNTQIRRELPTVIDLLALSLEAGMGLDRAIGIICDRSRSALSDELQHVLTDIGLGVSRQEAFVRLAERVRSDDIRLLSSSIIQSEQLGSSLVSTVRNQARVVRVARRRSAETQALKAPVKMLIPMVMFILPTLFLVVLGPAALNLTRALAPGNP